MCLGDVDCLEVMWEDGWINKPRVIFELRCRAIAPRMIAWLERRLDDLDPVSPPPHSSRRTPSSFLSRSTESSSSPPTTPQFLSARLFLSLHRGGGGVWVSEGVRKRRTVSRRLLKELPSGCFESSHGSADAGGRRRKRRNRSSRMQQFGSSPWWKTENAQSCGSLKSRERLPWRRLSLHAIAEGDQKNPAIGDPSQSSSSCAIGRGNSGGENGVGQLAGKENKAENEDYEVGLCRSFGLLDVFGSGDRSKQKKHKGDGKFICSGSRFH
uniref:Uncharacterized protein n=1 Tax=Chromera velia CCMP2878 TaxID=1169474 RepID=A0A0G4FP37_9ALVE|eukprot:Cvel_3576.t1-p1 / transcript=Cvel_3576.t1 / gene=Cvel_3576 / organism=Chromera_velia_CCMP2878 / gene_product=hypothetical protein / transcript_product=hypothetical protein / location=Cvel_scaffold146:67703-68971(+) / protein_length=268 / sequence_SO=supercontig / SO=protein_coding / is_pseudo=false